MTKDTGPSKRMRKAVGSRDGPHHVLPDTGWVTSAIDEPEGVGRMIELFRLSYHRALDARHYRDTAEARHA